MGLCLTLERGSYVQVGEVKIFVQSIYSGEGWRQVVLNFEGPREVPIVRGELLQETKTIVSEKTDSLGRRVAVRDFKRGNGA